jgi:hypothetical protein
MNTTKFRYGLLSIAGTLLAFSASPARGQLAYPMLMSARPIAVQVGTTADVTLSARYSMAGAYEVLVSESGVTGEVALPSGASAEDKKPLEKLPVRFTVAVDAQPGVRDIRVATPQGVSTVGQLVVVRDPVIAEAAKNDTPEQAQQVSLPAALCGCIEKNEDVDNFRFHADAGTSLVFVVRCGRLQDRIHDLQTHADPILTLRNSAGVTVAASDNHEYHADPLLAYRFEQAGDYLLEIRDVRYQGNAYWEYCIEANSRPWIDHVFPLAISPSQTAALSLAGFNLPQETTELTLPTEVQPGYTWLDVLKVDQPANPVPLLVADVPLVAEQTDAGDSLEAAQLVSVPAGINGRADREGDVDYYAFEAKKGEAFSFEVIARRRQSAMDSHLRVLDASGKQLALSDDLKLGKRTSADSWQENWTAPADGRYVVEVRDIHLRGGAEFPYFLKITRAEPYFELYLDTDKTQVTPGGCGAIFVRVERKNGFTGPVQLAIDGLPHGVTASCGRILDGKSQDGGIVLEADHDAPLNVAQATVRGTATHTREDGRTVELSAVAMPYQETYQPGGGRGHWPVESHTIAVTDYADLRGVYLDTYEVTLRPGESKRIGIRIDRSPDFKANVTLDVLMRHLNSTFANTLPPGVSLDDKHAQSLLTGSASEGYLTLTAAKDAPPVEKQQAVVLAHVALNFVMKWTYASQPLLVSVAKPE